MRLRSQFKSQFTGVVDGLFGSTLAQRLAAQLSIDGGPYLPIMLSIDGAAYQYVIVEDE